MAEKGIMGIDLSKMRILPSEEVEAKSIVLRYLIKREITQEEALDELRALYGRRRKLKIRKRGVKA